MPGKDVFTTVLAGYHLASRALPPSGKFGFHRTTYNGNVAKDKKRNNTWKEYYKKNKVGMLQLEEEPRGFSEEIERTLTVALGKVIQRLLRPSEMGTITLKPCLIHGDLFCGNTATKLETGEPITFDASAFCGHNECESVLHLLDSFRPD
jgi:fructosamine-3-kinase